MESMFVYHFVDPDLRVETFFEKDRVAENGSIDFELGGIGNSTHLYWRLKKISCRACLFSQCFVVVVVVEKKQFSKTLLLSKGLLTCTFILPLLSSESRKRYTLKLLLMCLEALEKGFSCFPERD